MGRAVTTRREAEREAGKDRAGRVWQRDTDASRMPGERGRTAPDYQVAVVPGSDPKPPSSLPLLLALDTHRILKTELRQAPCHHVAL